MVRFTYDSLLVCDLNSKNVIFTRTSDSQSSEQNTELWFRIHLKAHYTTQHNKQQYLKVAELDRSAAAAATAVVTANEVHFVINSNQITN